ncbi:MAG: molybdopterin-binding protein [Nitrospirae bacterium]|nr:molybdopterin-binding protein [Nitrospirota bacterium]
MTQTSGIIVIGDEILSGMVQDSNSLFMVRELRQIGIDVRHISVIRDDVADIAKEVGELSGRFDYIFTSGGIGPTHDDVTIEGVARAFGLKPAIDGCLRNFLERRFGKDLTPEQLRMAEVPEGAEVIEDDSIGLPLIHFKNIYILPGIPEYLREKFILIAKLLFNRRPPLLRKVYIAEYETRLAPVLNEIVKNNKEIKIGSYPAVNRQDYQVMVTLESYDEHALNSALQNLLGGIPVEKIIKVEG